MEKSRDVVVCGSCVVDVLVAPVPLERAIGTGKLVRTQPMQIATGGIVSNAGTTLARLGMRVAAFSYVGRDEWARLLRGRYEAERIDTSRLLEHPTEPTSTSVVLVDERGERSFLHAVGAAKRLDREAFLSQLDFFAGSRAMLLGYFSLLPNLQRDLPQVLAAVRSTGCLTAIDTAGTGGTLDELAPSLPHLDLYVPSLAEARHQTSANDPRQIIARYRDAGATGIVGVKLGSRGALLSGPEGELLEIAAIQPTGTVVDTTGAGDSFMAGLVCGLLKELPLTEAGRLAAACGAISTTALGATTAAGDYATATRLAGIF